MRQFVPPGLFLLFAAGCTGQIASGAATAGSGQGGGPGAPDDEGGGAGSGVGNDGTGGGGAFEDPIEAVPLHSGAGVARRLTRFEYNNTVRDLLGDTTRPADAFPDDDSTPWEFKTAISTGQLTATVYMEAAEALATRAVSNLGSIVPCQATTANHEACATEFITRFGLRAFRRPVDSEERNGLLALYRTARDTLGYDFAGGIRVLLSAMLQSPQFLYHAHPGPDEMAAQDADGLRHSAYTTASRLSYFLWGTMPDAALFEAAANGGLASPEQLRTQANRMLAADRAHDATGDLVSQIYHLGEVAHAPKDAKTFPMFTEALRGAALQASQRFASEAILRGEGTLRALLLDGQALANQGLATLYGVAGVTGDALASMPLPAAERAGLLTQVAFLAAMSGATNNANATPIKRGKVVRLRVLCQDIPPPDAAIVTRPSDGDTVRERLAEHTADAGCATCHRLMDPIGLAFERYDAVGRYRTEENGHPILTAGVLAGAGDEPEFADALQLMERLASLPETEACMARHVYRYATGRDPDDGEAETLRRLRAAGAFSIRDAMIEVTASPAFTHRLATQGEVLP